jgi:hypothetical protein
MHCNTLDQIEIQNSKQYAVIDQIEKKLCALQHKTKNRSKRKERNSTFYKIESSEMLRVLFQRIISQSKVLTALQYLFFPAKFIQS